MYAHSIIKWNEKLPVSSLFLPRKFWNLFKLLWVDWPIANLVRKNAANPVINEDWTTDHCAGSQAIPLTSEVAIEVQNVNNSTNINVCLYNAGWSEHFTAMFAFPSLDYVQYKWHYSTPDLPKLRISEFMELRLFSRVTEFVSTSFQFFLSISKTYFRCLICSSFSANSCRAWLLKLVMFVQHTVSETWLLLLQSVLLETHCRSGALVLCGLLNVKPTNGRSRPEKSFCGLRTAMLGCCRTFSTSSKWDVSSKPLIDGT